MTNFLKVFDKTKLRIGPYRLSYAHLLKPYAGPQGEAGKYQANILIPKADTKTVEAINAAVEAAIAEGIVSKWKGQRPKKIDTPLHDGDDKEDPLYENHYYINAKSTMKPQIVDRKKEIIADEEEVYSGMWAVTTINFYPYEVSGNKGVACALNCVLKYKDDARLGGGSSAEEDFADITLEDDDDDL